jgi:hypothetical protein
LCGMENLNDNNFNWNTIRDLDLVDYLASLGYQPETVKNGGTAYWYLSPLRNEREASFKVNRIRNQWFDFGLHTGGNTIDFGIAYFNCTLRELMDKFRSDPSLQQLPVAVPAHPQELNTKENKIVALRERPLNAFSLQKYLHERMIPLSVAKLHCCELSYEVNNRPFYAIGFKNDSGGFEIRSPIGKYSSSPKDITTVNQGATEVDVFEGFMDFLSFKTLHQQEAGNRRNFVVLNGAGLFEKARSFMEKHDRVRLWLDRDGTGVAYTKYALALDKKYRDESALYYKYKDLNDWLCNKTLLPNKHLKQKIR